MHFLQTLVPNRCSEDRLRGTHGDTKLRSDLTLFPLNSAPNSAPQVPTLTRKRVVSHTPQTGALFTSTHTVDDTVTASKLNPLAQDPHVSGPETAAQPL